MTHDDFEVFKKKWQAVNRQKEAPANAVAPGPGQESVWEYPVEPRIEAVREHVRVICGDHTIADTYHALRVIEKGIPPTYYVPLADVHTALLHRTTTETWCEWKGRAHYFSLSCEKRVLKDVAWTYDQPEPEYRELANHVAFYAGDLDCFIGAEKVDAQASGYYGGWVTTKIVGPFKNEPAGDTCAI